MLWRGGRRWEGEEGEILKNCDMTLDMPEYIRDIILYITAPANLFIVAQYFVHRSLYLHNSVGNLCI